MFKIVFKIILLFLGFSIIGAIFYFTEDSKRVDLDTEILTSIGKAVKTDTYEKGIYFGEHEFLSIYKEENDDNLTVVYFKGEDKLEKAYFELDKDELIVDYHHQDAYERILSNFNTKNKETDVLIVDVN